MSSHNVNVFKEIKNFTIQSAAGRFRNAYYISGLFKTDVEKYSYLDIAVLIGILINKNIADSIRLKEMRN